MLGDGVRTYSNVMLNVVVRCIDRRETPTCLVIDKRYCSKSSIPCHEWDSNLCDNT